MTMKKLMLAGYCEHEFSDECVICESARLNAELDSLKAQLATEREAHARTLAALKLRGCDFHEFKTDGWTACAAEMPLDQKGWCRTCAAIAAAKVTP